MDSAFGRSERHVWGWRGGEVGPAETHAWRVETLLRRLESLATAAQITGAVHKATPSPPLRLSARLSPPASLDTIGETELRLGMALPADFGYFLLRADGAELAENLTSPGATLDLLGSRAMIRCAEERECSDRVGCVPDHLIFASIGSSGDGLAFALGRVNPWGGCAVLDARHGYSPDRWWVIACDFTDWLERVLKEPGPPGSFGRHWEHRTYQPSLPLSDPLPPPSKTNNP